MWLVNIAFGLVLTVTSTEVGSDQTKNDSNQPAIIFTRQTLFSIPFRVDQMLDKPQQPTEVQLLVSNDRGAHWYLYARALPNQKQIPFRTATDGEYWFAIRTVDRAGKAHPETIPGPGLRVIVDTTPPQMQFSAQNGPAGQTSALWQITDIHLKPESLSIQYRTAPNGPWQTLALTEKNSTISETMQSGEVSWWPESGSHEIQIRAEATDTSGNKAVSHAQVKKIDQDTVPEPGIASKQKNIEGLQQSPGGTIEQSANMTTNGDAQSMATSQGIYPPIGNRYQSAGEAPSDPELKMLPPGERPRMINTRLFELDYDLESVGPSGISRVELWGTRDGGRSWRMFTVDDDNRSPISISVDEEGIYGFRVVATSGAGLSQQFPKSGDLPSIWVGVDLTKPIARITAAELGKGSAEGRMNISWEAADKMLAERPITLVFSQNPGGPWTTIAAGLENTGRYSWVIDSRVPLLIYLRLEVRDEAGNLTISESPDPVALDQLRPAAKIKDVRPVAKNQ